MDLNPNKSTQATGVPRRVSARLAARAQAAKKSTENTATETTAPAAPGFEPPTVVAEELPQHERAGEVEDEDEDYPYIEDDGEIEDEKYDEEQEDEGMEEMEVEQLAEEAKVHYQNDVMMEEELEEDDIGVGLTTLEEQEAEWEAKFEEDKMLRRRIITSQDSSLLGNSALVRPVAMNIMEVIYRELDTASILSRIEMDNETQLRVRPELRSVRNILFIG